MPRAVVRRKQIRKTKKVKVSYGKNGEKELSLEALKFPTYEEIKREIEKKIGKMPPRPQTLPKGEWSEQALRVLEERYLIRDKKGKIIETPEDMCWRVAWEIASAEARWGKTRREVLGKAKEFYNLLVSRKFLPNSPTLMNAGTGNNLQFSACFVLPVEDSMEGIFDALKYQALIHKSGGGTGFSFSRLRPKGSMVRSSSGSASGPVSFMRIFDAATNEVKQGGKRRGANMGILRVDHPDIKDFIHCKEEGGITNFNISVAITDRFMEAYEKGEEYELVDPRTGKVVGSLSAKEVFDEIADAAWRTGDPGLVFIDRINAGKSNPVPSLGPIESTNPCVTGDTLVSTKDGLERMKDLYKKGGAEVLIDGRLGEKSFAKAVRIVKSGIKPVYKLLTKEGYEVKLTGDHKILTPRGWIEAKSLRKGEKIFIINRKGGFGKEGDRKEGRVLGWLASEGTVKASRAVLSFLGREKGKSAYEFAYLADNRPIDGRQGLGRDYSVGGVGIKGQDKARDLLVGLWRYALENGIELGDKLKVPERVLKGSEEMQKGFLQALFTADGYVTGTRQKGVSVRLTSVSLELLKDVQRLLLNFGIASKIYTKKRGGRGRYICRAYHNLVISQKNLFVFAKEISFLVDYKNAKLVDSIKEFEKFPYKESFEATFDKLVPLRKEVVYDLTEPTTSSFVANGIVVHNCGEQPLYPFDACNLGSIFLRYFVKEEDGKRVVDWEELKKTTKLAIRFLDNVIEVNPYPLEQIRRMVFAIRRVGLGVGGWADMLVLLGIPYDSEEALQLGERIMRTIQEEAVRATQELAKERGPFPLWPVSIYKNQKPRRNSTVTTIAPTGTISIIAGTSSGIEPLYALAFQHVVKDEHLSRTLTFINPDFIELAQKRGIWNEMIEKKVAESGVIRDIEEIPEDIRALFGTAHEIHHDWHIKMQAVFQKYTENAVSKTINMENKVSREDVKKAYLLAWEMGCEGITVFRDGCKDAQVLNLGIKGKDRKNDRKERQESSDQAVIDRPFVVRGATYKLNTPVGTAFVTINEDERGNPLEVFINVGKAGSDVTAMAEALGRTISTSLRLTGGLNPRQRAEEIAKQLSGIGGRRSVGFGPNKIRSLPDAIAVALSSHFGFRMNGNGNHVTNNINNIFKKVGASAVVKDSSPPGAEKTSFWGLKDPAPAPTLTLLDKKLEKESRAQVTETSGDICPSCGASALVYEEGCSKCYACGHSEC